MVRAAPYIALITLLLLFGVAPGFAQGSDGDKKDSITIKALLVSSYNNSTRNPSQGLSEAQEIIRLAGLHHWNVYVANAHRLLAINYLTLTNYPLAIQQNTIALELSEAISDDVGVAKAMGNLGNVYLYQSDYPKALDYYLRALKIHERLGRKASAAVNLGNIGALYQLLADDVNARKYVTESSALFHELRDTLGEANQTQMMGNIYYNEKDPAAAQRYYHQARALYMTIGDKNDYGHCLLNIANTVIETGSYERALPLLDTASGLFKIQDDKGGLEKASLIYARLYLAKSLDSTAAGHLPLTGQQKNEALLQAIHYSTQCAAYAASLNRQEDLVQASLIHAQAAQRAGYFAEAALGFQQAYVLGDSLHSMNNAKKIIGLESKREIELRDNQLKISALQLTNQKQHSMAEAAAAAALALQQQQELALRQSALDLSNKNLSLTEKEKEVQSLAFEKQQGEYIRAQQAKDNQLKLAAQQSKIQELEIQSSHRARLAFIAGLLLLSGVAAFVIRQSALRKKANQQLAFSNRQLDEANRVKARFFGILSHDLRAPVSNLTSFLYLQREAPEMMDERARKSHQLTIELAANNLLSVMEDLLLWSKGQMTNFKPTIKTVQVLQLFEEIKKLLPYDTTTDVVFDDPGLLKIDTDENFLKTIMRNLTANALKALGNQPDGKVEWKAWEEGGKSFMSITDNGPGLTKDQLEKLFSESAVTSAKTGLGLHMVRDFAQMLGQKIEVKSELGKGTSFILSRAA